MSAIDAARLLRIVRQQAQTAELLGVDFVPSFTRAQPVQPAPVQPAPAQPAPVQLAPVPAPEARATVPPASEPARAPVPPPAPEASVPTASAPIAAPVAESSDRARESVQAQLDAILARYEADAPHRKFKTAHTRIVFGEGDPLARLMFIGEAPGADEDREGRPFVGVSGDKLNEMIRAMGLTRESVYIANVMKTRPPNNETPTFDEMRHTLPYLFEQIRAIRPEVIVILGGTALKGLMPDVRSGITRARGEWLTWVDEASDLRIPVMPTFHPAYLLRNYTPETRRAMWSDLKLVMERLGLAIPASKA